LSSGHMVRCLDLRGVAGSGLLTSLSALVGGM
jgi:hypothetical protein